MSLKSNIQWIGSSHVIVLALSLISFTLVIRHYGPVEYGKFIYASSIVSMLSLLALFGQPQILIRDLAHDPTQTNKALSVSVFILLFSTILLLAFSISLKPFLDYDPWIFLLVYLSAAIGNLTQIFWSILRAYEKMEFEGVSNIVKTILYVLLVVLIIYIFYSTSIADVIIAGIMVSIGLLAATIWWISKSFSLSFGSFPIDKKMLYYHLKSGLSMLMISIGVVIYQRIDSVMIGKMLGNYEVGLYGVAYQLFEIATGSIVVILAVFYPRFSKLKAEPVLFMNLFKKLTFLIIVLGIGAWLGAVLLGHIVIPLVFGQVYMGSVGAFKILAFVVGISSLGSLFGLGFRVYHLESQFAVITLCAGLLNFIMNLFAIPRYGIEGAAGTTLITILLVVFASIILSYRILRKGQRV